MHGEWVNMDKSHLPETKVSLIIESFGGIDNARTIAYDKLHSQMTHVGKFGNTVEWYNKNCSDDPQHYKHLTEVRILKLAIFLYSKRTYV